jgi:DNA-binding GntR family transcriptional regulator
MENFERKKRINKNVFEPIRDLEQINRLRQNLKNQPRDLLFFDLVTQTGVRVKELLNLRVKDLFGLKVGDALPLSSPIRHKDHSAIMTDRIFYSFQSYLKQIKPSVNDYVFESRKGKKPLTLSSISHLIRKWYKAANIDARPGVKSLRKTWVFHFKETPYNYSGRTEQLPSEGVLKPVQAGTLREAVFNELFQAILLGKISPGERIVTRKIAKQMKVSSMPVRDALARLEANGFLSLRNRRAYVVNELSIQNLHEIFKIRITLECMAAEAACHRYTKETIRRLKDLHKLFVKSGIEDKIEELIQLNREFHRTLLQDANMPILNQILDSLWIKTSPYFNIPLFRGLGDFDVKKMAVLHEKILSGMISRNVKKLCEALQEDIMSGSILLDQAFESIRKR